MTMVVSRVVMAQVIGHSTRFQKERTHIVRQDDGSRRGHRCRHGAHAGSKDRGNKQASQADGQPVDDKIGEHIVGLLRNVGRQRSHTCLVVAVQRRAYEEEQGRNRNEQVAAEESRELGILVSLGSMVALYVVLVDTIVLQVDEDTINQTHPERRGGQVVGKGTQRELVAHRRVGSQLKGLHRPLGHGKHQDAQTQQGTSYQNNTLYGVCPDDGLQTAHHRVDDDADGGQNDDRMQVPPHQDVHRHSQ